VVDQGVGISPENQQKLFVLFAQIRPHELQGGSGSGLGLALAKEIVLMHGGQLLMDSEEGRGNSFGFRMRFAILDVKPVHNENLDLHRSHNHSQSMCDISMLLESSASQAEIHPKAHEASLSRGMSRLPPLNEYDSAERGESDLNAFLSLGLVRGRGIGLGLGFGAGTSMTNTGISAGAGLESHDEEEAGGKAGRSGDDRGYKDDGGCRNDAHCSRNAQYPMAGSRGATASPMNSVSSASASASVSASASARGLADLMEHQSDDHSARGMGSPRGTTVGVTVVSVPLNNANRYDMWGDRDRDRDRDKRRAELRTATVYPAEELAADRVSEAESGSADSATDRDDLLMPVKVKATATATQARTSRPVVRGNSSGSGLGSSRNSVSNLMMNVKARRLSKSHSGYMNMTKMAADDVDFDNGSRRGDLLCNGASESAPCSPRVSFLLPTPKPMSVPVTEQRGRDVVQAGGGADGRKNLPLPLQQQQQQQSPQAIRKPFLLVDGT
jgi:hypothetical protein